jgi:choline dehydrogenase-like flavoprotein
MADREYDVCIVGSGPGGGIVSYVLATAGLKVALVEMGRRLRPGADYNAHQSIYDNLDRRLSEGKRAVVSSVWNDFAERDHFTPVGDRPAHGQLRAVGGRSICWAGHSLRFGPGDYRQWPISYDEVAPYYAKAEALMGVHGMKDGLWNLPDGVFQKGVPMRCPELALKRGVERLKSRGRHRGQNPHVKRIMNSNWSGRVRTWPGLGNWGNGSGSRAHLVYRILGA